MAAPTVATQTPANSAYIRVLPTAPTGYRTRKFAPSRKYAEEERIKNESGQDAIFNFIDLQTEVDIELWVTDSAAAEILPGAELQFTTPAATNALPYFGLGASATFKVMVMGDVKPAGEAGHVALVTFKGFFNGVIGGASGA